VYLHVDCGLFCDFRHHCGTWDSLWAGRRRRAWQASTIARLPALVPMQCFSGAVVLQHCVTKRGNVYRSVQREGCWPHCRASRPCRCSGSAANSPSRTCAINTTCHSRWLCLSGGRCMGLECTVCLNIVGIFCISSQASSRIQMDQIRFPSPWDLGGLLAFLIQLPPADFYNVLGKMSEVDKKMNPQHFGSDAADIRIRINPEIWIWIRKHLCNFWRRGFVLGECSCWVSDIWHYLRCRVQAGSDFIVYTC